jgi:hypothetical protein
MRTQQGYPPLKLSFATSPTLPSSKIQHQKDQQHWAWVTRQVVCGISQPDSGRTRPADLSPRLCALPSRLGQPNPASISHPSTFCRPIYLLGKVKQVLMSSAGAVANHCSHTALHAAAIVFSITKPLTGIGRKHILNCCS